MMIVVSLCVELVEELLDCQVLGSLRHLFWLNTFFY